MILEGCQIWHLSILAPVIFKAIVREGGEFNGDNILSKSCKSFSFDEIWNSTQIKDTEFNGDKIFCDSWGLSFLAPVDIGNCHLSPNVKSSNFDETLYFTQTEGGEFNGDNSFFVILDACQYWQLSILVPVIF